MKLLLASAIALLFTVQAAEARLRLGLAWGTDNSWMKTIAKGNIEWYHHWQEAAVPGAPSSVDYVPMYWGPKYASKWASRQAEMKKNQPSRLLFVNEPDVESQSNLSPSRAAELFMSEMVPWQKKGVKVSSPQIVWNFDWLDSFMKAVKAKGAKPDFVALHWYGSYKDIAGLKSFVKKAYKRYGLSIWLTEYGVTNKSGASASEMADFLQEATSWLASQSYVKRAAWLGCFAINDPPDSFASAKNAFFNSNGSLRSMANWYVGASLSKRSLSDSAAHVIRSPGAIRHLKGRSANHREIARNLSKAAERDAEAESASVDDDEDDDEESSTRSETESEDAHCDKYCKLRAASVANASEDDDFLKGDDMGDLDSLLD
ncbi:glycoside hydrolase [Microstroma glucosiphilum]|uniref:Glycoside hydrolase n=1 Tax=Pseudomicrostroma glucosiphilum TaxID=1684307 RepID=A0A316UC28_9BASI|nr:glycoside hydrolase [Pseudomicrostroma glucosiphilum]PWN22780.1 glycoside hydrolase [Pseudomicrostroma glucosiphilum]